MRQIDQGNVDITLIQLKKTVLPRRMWIYSSITLLLTAVLWLAIQHSVISNPLTDEVVERNSSFEIVPTHTTMTTERPRTIFTFFATLFATLFPTEIFQDAKPREFVLAVICFVVCSYLRKCITDLTTLQEEVSKLQAEIFTDQRKIDSAEPSTDTDDDDQEMAKDPNVS